MSLHEKEIKTKYVFTKNNQVFLKRDKHNLLKNKKTDNLMEWFPINFQWIELVNLNIKTK